MDNIIICPICQELLQNRTTLYCCQNNHSFDRAKEGYLNLLLVNQKVSRSPGDDLEMVRSRRNFLDQGMYLFLADTLNDVIKNNLSLTKRKETITILDSGSGEGYYLNQLTNFLTEQNISHKTYGIDISKEAIKLAAKTYTKSFYAIANINYKLPFSDQSFNVITNIFAPHNSQEYKRILAKDGILIVVFPTESHLKNLREKISGKVSYQNKQESITNIFSKEFTLIDTKQIERQITFSKNQATLLIKMTPLFWQIDHLKLEGIADMISTEVGFNLYVFKKTS